MPALRSQELRAGIFPVDLFPRYTSASGLGEELCNIHHGSRSLLIVSYISESGPDRSRSLSRYAKNNPTGSSQ